MAFKWISSPVASILPLIGIGLAIANWQAMPAAAWAWTAVIAMFVIMIVVRRHSQVAVQRSPGDPALVRSANSVSVAVLFSSLMMIVPLALTLAHAYGVVGDPSEGMQRVVMIMIGAYLAMTGNTMPKMLPPTMSLGCEGARVQAFHRRAGWTWTLCGIGLVIAWLVLPIHVAGLMSVALVGTAVVLTVVRLQYLRKPRPQMPRMN
jgi:hypothetical protein